MKNKSNSAKENPKSNTSPSPKPAKLDQKGVPENKDTEAQYEEKDES